MGRRCRYEKDCPLGCQDFRPKQDDADTCRLCSHDVGFHESRSPQMSNCVKVLAVIVVAVGVLFVAGAFHLPLSVGWVGMQRGSSVDVFSLARGGDLALLAQHMNVTARDARGMTVLFHAADAGRPDAVELICDAGADVSARAKDGALAAHHAARRGHSAVINVLAKRGAELSAHDTAGYSPVYLAVRYGHADTVRALAAHGVPLAEKDRQGWTLLHAAARFGHTDTLQQLLRLKCCNAAAQTKTGVTAERLARMFGHAEAAVLLAPPPRPVAHAPIVVDTAPCEGRGSCERSPHKEPLTKQDSSKEEL